MLYEAVKICREIPEAEVMTEDTFGDGHNYPRFNDELDRARRVFLAGLDSATSVNPSSGGGCMSNGYAVARQELGLSSFCPLRQDLRSCPVLS